jgi:hypothetical protein
VISRTFANPLLAFYTANMQSPVRHQCVIYEGSPAKHLGGLAALIARKLRANHRCLYLNSRTMVAGIRTYLAAGGLDVESEVARGALVLSSDQTHLTNGRFDVSRMLELLAQAVDNARGDGFAGLWATGDMTWEFGGEKDFAKLLEYEQGLEDLFARQPALGGLCQYHAETLPADAIRDALYTHEAVYISETLARINPYYATRYARAHSLPAVSAPEVQQMLGQLRRSAEAQNA